MAASAYVGRPSPYGNPYSVRATCLRCGEYHAEAGSTLPCFLDYALERLALEPDWLQPLRGRELYCPGCPAGSPTCHARILERLLTRPPAPPKPRWCTRPYCPHEGTHGEHSPVRGVGYGYYRCAACQRPCLYLRSSARTWAPRCTRLDCPGVDRDSEWRRGLGMSYRLMPVEWDVLDEREYDEDDDRILAPPEPRVLERVVGKAPVPTKAIRYLDPLAPAWRPKAEHIVSMGPRPGRAVPNARLEPERRWFDSPRFRATAQGRLD